MAHNKTVLATLELAKRVVMSEAHALLALQSAINETLFSVVELILQCQGRLFLSGVGKSNHIAQKLASTFASTGTPAFFIHPTEASHGDMGMIMSSDVLLALSRSGEAEELNELIGYCKSIGVPTVCITSEMSSALASLSDHVMLIPQLPEACTLGLAPTTSSTMMLALGDAIAIACLERRRFSKADFKALHPGGKLGKSLLRVLEVMHRADELPLITVSDHLSDAIIEMTRCRFGCVGITDGGILVGIFTDGDLRRNLLKVNLNRPISDFMTTNPLTLDPKAYIVEVIHLFKERRIPSAFVCENNKVIGIVHIHDLLQRGLL